jgi:hypothetical protein
MKMRNVLAVLAVAALAISPETVFAHAAWKIGGTTPPRSNDMGLKDNTGNNGCGNPNLKRGTNPVTLVVGQPLKLQWTEYIYHRGYYRVAISPSGQVGAEFDDPKNQWLKMDNSTDMNTPKEFEQTITVPNTPCANCTLQFTQFMTDTGTNYYSCSDIVIVPANGTPAPSPTPKAGDDCAK